MERDRETYAGYNNVIGSLIWDDANSHTMFTFSRYDIGCPQCDEGKEI